MKEYKKKRKRPIKASKRREKKVWLTKEVSNGIDVEDEKKIKDAWFNLYIYIFLIPKHLSP